MDANQNEDCYKAAREVAEVLLGAMRQLRQALLELVQYIIDIIVPLVLRGVRLLQATFYRVGFTHWLHNRWHLPMSLSQWISWRLPQRWILWQPVSRVSWIWCAGGDS